MISSADFIHKFHNLEGITLREKKKSFHLLLKSIEDSDAGFLGAIIQSLTPSTYLEQTLKIDLLIYFKRTDDLINILMSGEDIEACKIIQQSWFIKELMKIFTASHFVEVVVPNLSLSIRTKIYKKILVYIKDENRIQELFEKLYRTYGLNVAIVLLVGCSTDKIKEYVNENLVKLSATQLKVLFDKDKSLITTYFDKLKSEGDDIYEYKLSSFLNYVGIKDPVFYFEITDKYSLHKQKLGRRSTKKFIASQKEKVIEKPTDFVRFLREDALVRKLGEHFPIFYKNGLPKTSTDFRYSHIKPLIKYYNKSQQYELYFNTFQEKYNKSLWDNTDCMDEKLIELIPDKAERDKWISKFENRGNIKKYETQAKCFRSAKRRRMVFVENDTIFAENVIKERKTIFNTLISTCKLSKDYDAFLNILKSFCERHRNSDVTILFNFLRTIYKELDTNKFKDEHWKYIYEIIKIQLFKKQQIFYPMFVKYIKFVYHQNKSIENSVQTLLNELPQSLSNFEYDNEEFEKSMLNMYLKLIPEINDVKDMLTIQIALSVIKWNKKHPNDMIFISNQKNILDVIMKLKDSTTTKQSHMMKIFKYLICSQDESQEESELDKIYWLNFKNLNNKTITMWFVKYKPHVLKKNLDKIGIILKDKNVNLVRTLKKYDYIDIPNDISKLCLEELENSEPSKRGRVVKILVSFMAVEDLEKYFRENIPKVGKMDVNGGDEEVQKSYEIQCALAKYLKLTVNLKKFLPDLLNYCQGDVLGSALPSLYSSFCRIPENLLYSALEELNTKAVSVRKHTLFLSCLILPTEKVLMKYRQVQELEKNSSVKQHMFLSCYKYFLKNNVPEFWPILENYILQLKKEQKDVLKLFTDAHKVPKEFRAVFTERSWDKLSKLKKDYVEIDDKMESLLRSLTKNDVMMLRDEFCIDVIQNKLFDFEECATRTDVFDFAKKFLLYGKNSEIKINSVFKVLHDFKEKFWNDCNKKMNILEEVHKFCFHILNDMLKNDIAMFDKNFPKLFRDAWKKEFELEETFEENLMIDFVIFKFESEIKTELLLEQMNRIFTDAIQKYGSLIITSFKNFLSSYLNLVWNYTDSNLRTLKFLDTFLEQNSSPEHCALAIELLPTGYMEEEAKEAKKNLIDKLSQKEQIVKICLFGKLKTGY